MPPRPANRAFYRTWAVSIPLVLFLSGCLAGDDPPSAAGPGDPGGGPLDGQPGDPHTRLDPNDAVPVPTWELGDWWGMHFYFGSDPGEGHHINAIVTSASPTEYQLATDSRQGAKMHATDDLLVLGGVSSSDLTLSGFGGTWDLLEFPLTDGATWEGAIPNIAFDVLPEGPVPLTFTATYSDELDAAGARLAGYEIEGRTDAGVLVVHLAYAPSVRWITSMTVYDIDPGQDPVEFTLTLMDRGEGWTGTYFVDVASVVLDNYDAAGLTEPPPDGTPFAEPSPHVTFTISDDATYLYGFFHSQAAYGVREVFLFPPEGEMRQYEVTGAPEGSTGRLIDEAAIPGEWRLVTIGAGGMTSNRFVLSEIVEMTGSL